MLNIIGLDIGTTTLSAVVVDASKGEIIKSVTVPNSYTLPDTDGFHKMQNPDAIVGKMLEIKDELVAEYGNISAIGVTGQMHGIVYCDACGNAVSPLYTWQDASGQKEYKGTTYARYLSELTGYNMASGYGLTTHFVNICEGNAPENAVTMCTVHDYLVMKLCGNTAPIMHTSDAASFGCFDIKKAAFDKVALEKIGVDYSFMSTTSSNIDIAGKDINGIPVSLAIGDNQASVLGSVKGDCDVLINIGTGSQVSLITDALYADGNIELRPLYNTKNLLVGAPLCGGRSFALLHRFFKDCAALLGGDTDNVYKMMDTVAEQDLKNHPIAVDTRFCGTRRNPDIRGSVSEISEENFTPANLTRGFLWGMSEELFTLYSEMCEVSSKKAVRMVASGNAVRKSLALREYLKERFSLSLDIPAHKEEAAYGAALFGAVAAEIFSDIDTAQNKMVHYLGE